VAKPKYNRHEHEAKIKQREAEISASDTFGKFLPNRFVVYAHQWTSEAQCAWLNRETIEQYRERLRRKA